MLTATFSGWGIVKEFSFSFQSLASIHTHDSASATVLEVPGIYTASTKILRDSHLGGSEIPREQSDLYMVPPQL